MLLALTSMQKWRKLHYVTIIFHDATLPVINTSYQILIIHLSFKFLTYL